MPLPPDLAEIWQRGVDAGFKLGALYPLAYSLSRRAGGSYNGMTGDVWMVVRPEVDDNRRTLLHELGHAQQNTEGSMVDPATIEEDWAQEADTWHRAAALARQWGYGDLFTDEWLRERLEREGQICEWCLAAADLFGTSNPRVARAALNAAQDVAWDGETPWDEERFAAALYGYSEDDTDVAAMVQLNRWAGRGSYSTGHIRQGEGFGPCDVGDEARQRATSWLLDALRRLRGGLSTRVTWTQRAWGRGGPEFLHLGLLTLDGDEHLPQAIEAIRAMLVDRLPERSVAAYATAYGDGQGQPRVYRIEAMHARAGGEKDAPQSELYILVPPERHRAQTAEAALQLYLRGWRKGMAYRHGPLSEGLELVWSLLGGRL